MIAVCAHSFLVQCIGGLLALVFGTRVQCLSTKTFALFEESNPGFTTFLIETVEFAKIADRVLSASVLSVNCSFVLKFLPFMGKTGVLDLFECLFGSSENLQKGKEGKGFATRAHSRAGIDWFGSKDRWDETANGLLALLDLLRDCTANAVLVL
jgi:hypothetical protein